MSHFCEGCRFVCIRFKKGGGVEAPNKINHSRVLDARPQSRGRYLEVNST